jgi:serine/threonine protein phosphatase PrpC
MTEQVLSVFDMNFQEAIISPETHNISISEHTEQMHKKQDQTYSGEAVDDVTGEIFKYGMVTDGHGSDLCINFLRSITKDKMAEIISKKNPVEAMAKYVNENVGNVYSSGATMCLTKVYKDRIECINCGDSQVAVFKDKELVYISKEHNWENEEERQRLLNLNKGIYFTPAYNIKVINKTQMIGCYSEYANWPDDSMLACTQALGSNGKTGYNPHHEIIKIEAGSVYKVVIGSDGLWDMIIKDDIEDIKQLCNMNAKEGVEVIVSRWLQEWEMKPLNSTVFIKSKFSRRDSDDVCMVSIDIIPNILP